MNTANNKLYEELTHYEKEIFWDVKELYQRYDTESEQWVCKQTTKKNVCYEIDRLSSVYARMFHIHCIDRGIRFNKVRDAFYKQLRKQIVTEKVYWAAFYAKHPELTLQK